MDNENNLAYYFSMDANTWKARWTKEQIRAMLLEQSQTFWQRDTGVERTQLAQLEQAAPSPHAVIISGLRRVGKSTLLAQLAHRLGQDRFYYINFEDDRFLGFGAQDSNDLYQSLAETFGERKIWIVDEIQNVPGWEHFVRRFMDMGWKFYITGSNASLLSRELGSRLTGRYVPIELFPFSFNEFLRFRQFDVPDVSRLTTLDMARLQQHLSEYLQVGGLPEPLKYPDLPLRRTLYDDVLYRDIATRYHIEEVRTLKELAFYLMSNLAGRVSFNKLKEQLRLGSVNTVKNYFDCLENSWLIFTLNVYDHSVKRQQIAPKKVYGIDTGLSNDVGFAFSANAGKLLENLVFLALRRKTKEIYYYLSPFGYEVDFYLPETRQLIQVAQNLDDPTTRTEEIRALSDAMRALNLSRGLILWDANAKPIEENGLTIDIRSVADWLVSE
jgi:predicted AAA+ superfamily ATPase